MMLPHNVPGDCTNPKGGSETGTTRGAGAASGAPAAFWPEPEDWPLPIGAPALPCGNAADEEETGASACRSVRTGEEGGAAPEPESAAETPSVEDGWPESVGADAGVGAMFEGEAGAPAMLESAGDGALDCMEARIELSESALPDGVRAVGKFAGAVAAVMLGEASLESEPPELESKAPMPIAATPMPAAVRIGLLDMNEPSEERNEVGLPWHVFCAMQMPGIGGYGP